jgi:hypothetical protein
MTTPPAPVQASHEQIRRPRHLTVDLAIAVVLGALALGAVLLLEPVVAGGIMLVTSAVFLLRRWVFNWTTMLFALAAIIMFIPIRRYALPISVGFELEPYRVAIVGLLIAIAVASANQRRFPWQPVLWGWPIAIFLWCMFASLMFNAVELTSRGALSGGFSNLTQLIFLLSTIVIFRQLLREPRVVMAFLSFLVYAGAFVGLFAFLERVTRRNIFLMFHNFLPLVLLREDAESLRAGGGRAYASSQHPIALSVMFAMLIPLAIYLMKFGRWPRFVATRRLLLVVCIGLMLIGLLSAVSRTGIVVLGIMFLFVLLMRPRLAGIMLAIGLPIVAVMGLVLPQLFESTIGSLLNPEALIASQFSSIGMAGQGRLADLPDAFAQAAAHPWAGTGLGSRVVVGEEANAQILDNQWLGSLLETGAIGVIGLIVFLAWPIIAMIRFSFRTDVAPARAYLTFATATSALGYATAMLFYDAFAFMQTLLVLCMMYAIAAWAMTDQADVSHWGARRERSRAASPSMPEPAR